MLRRQAPFLALCALLVSRAAVESPELLAVESRSTREHKVRRVSDEYVKFGWHTTQICYRLRRIRTDRTQWLCSSIHDSLSDASENRGTRGILVSSSLPCSTKLGCGSSERWLRGEVYVVEQVVEHLVCRGWEEDPGMPFRSLRGQKGRRGSEVQLETRQRANCNCMDYKPIYNLALGLQRLRPARRTGRTSAVAGDLEGMSSSDWRSDSCVPNTRSKGRNCRGMSSWTKLGNSMMSLSDDEGTSVDFL